MTIETVASPFAVAVAGRGEERAASQGGEADAIAASQRGEREAFDELVLRYQRDVYRLCYRYVNNHEDANDLAQEVFLKAYRAIGGFRGDSSFSTWLYRIAVNTCLNFRSARKPPAQELSDSVPDHAAS